MTMPHGTSHAACRASSALHFVDRVSCWVGWMPRVTLRAAYCAQVGLAGDKQFTSTEEVRRTIRIR